MADDPGSADRSELDLGYRDLALRAEEMERRDSLDRSFPRKWGTVFWPGAATIIVALVSGAFSFWQFEETKRLELAEQIELTRLKSIENGRAAVQMYFDKPDLFTSRNDKAAAHFEMLIAISDNPGLARALEKLGDAIRTERTSFPASAGLKEGTAALGEGLPTVPSADWSDAAAYTVYVQYVRDPACKVHAEALQAGLQARGFRVPGVEGIPAGNMPDATQIRFYRSDQEELYSEQLETEIPILLDLVNMGTVESHLLKGNLPRSTFEIWLGKDDCPGS